MGSSVSCLGGGSKSRGDQNGQAALYSPRSGRVLSGAGNNVQVFSLNELKAATRNFHMMNCIGRGGFGTVYKGNLKDGTQIAIKKLSAESKQGTNEFLTEINVVSNIRHPNLVKLIGCCVEGNNRILVYEYAENNSLANALLGPKNKCIPLDWQKRAAICIGTASGLAFLHEEAQPRIVHRDIKASNILLDKKLLPKIGDFGLAKLFPDTVTHISTRVAGTMGYLAPEYALLGQLTKKADIFSFGVLLLEVISGQSSSKSTWGRDMHVLVEWTWKLREEGRLLEIVDPELEGYPEEQVLHFIKMALLCTQATSQQRPSMKQVVQMLSNQTEIDLQNLVPPGVVKEPRHHTSGLGGLTLDTSSSQSIKCNPSESCSTQTNMNSYELSTVEVSPR
uniref:Protein kinase domain-containing protein n=1 Tax=Arundo donax TaxID=35708 RepID=A0A0A9D7S2_ARUDO